MVEKIGSFLDRMSDRYESSLGRTFWANVRIVIGIGVALLLLGYVGQRFVGSGFLPDMG